MKPQILSLFSLAAFAVASGLAQAQLKANAPSAIGAAVVNPADTCAREPQFIKKFGMSQRTVMDTTQAQPVGITIAEVDLKGNVTRRGHHPSWSTAGYMGRVLRDGEGYVYTYPVASFSLEHNPPEKANIVYRIDTETAVMTPFVEIKSEHRPSARNPFGLLALTLDCGQNALYAASVMGSTASEERGVIARIDLKTRDVKIVKSGIDVLSLTVGANQAGRRLYVGTARDNAVISFGIDAQGNLSDTSNLEIDLDAHPAAQDKRARVLRWTNSGLLTVRAIPFEFTLTARSAIPTAEMSFAATRTGDGKLKYDVAAQRSYDHKGDAHSISKEQAATLPGSTQK